MEDSYFSSSVAGLGDRLRPRLDREDSVDDVFTISGCNTPTLETDPACVFSNWANADARRCEAGERRIWRKKNAGLASVPRHNTSIERSKPIPIEITKSKSDALIEPVTARGDLAEAYFPMHEKDDERQHLYQPHPFDQEVKKARQQSISEAEASVAATEARNSVLGSTNQTSQGVSRTLTAPAVRRADVNVRGPTAAAERRADATKRTRTAPVVDAYNPTGSPGVAASLGKYYPTNYNKNCEADSSSLSRPGPPAPGPSSLSFCGADQEHHLLQYKRDIISQTTQIARENLGRKMQSTASFRAVESVLDARTRKSVALLRRYKPSSPRITPLLSPGPVTPMTLDGNGEPDYLSVRGARQP